MQTLFGPSRAIFLPARTQKVKCNVRGHFEMLDLTQCFLGSLEFLAVAFAISNFGRHSFGHIFAK